MSEFDPNLIKSYHYFIVYIALSFDSLYEVWIVINKPACNLHPGM